MSSSTATQGGGEDRGFAFDDAVRQADELLAQEQTSAAIESYQLLLAQAPDHPHVLHNLAVALCQLGRYREAESNLRRVVQAQPDFPEAHNNLGYVLRALGRFAQAEVAIREAVAADPVNATFQCNLGETLLLLGQGREAEACFLKVQQTEPQHLGAALGLGEIARREGRFQDAERIFRGIVQRHGRIPGVWALLASLRKMTATDAAWLNAAEELASGKAVSRIEEVGLRFAIGKYWDDLGKFAQAFQSYRRANELLKSTVPGYNRAARVQFVTDLIRVYRAETVAQVGASGSGSLRPIFVIGMPRSGTSLVEQIIASHPQVKGAGELGFWTEVVLRHTDAIRAAVLPEQQRKQLATEYLRLLTDTCGDAPHVVDKAPVNAEYLGLIHSVLPRARVIYMRRNAIDTCLSCYFQQFSTALSYTMDLSDLAHYCRTHYQLMAHWRSVLPEGTLLDVPYEELVADQEGWTRKILSFIGLPWHDQCLEFHRTQRAVTTASSWQVRQRIYQSSVERWRNYEAFIGPLLELDDLRP